jgi:hypothetical protein
MEVQAISTAIDLRYPQIYPFCGAVADPCRAVGLGDIFGESANRISKLWIGLIKEKRV